MLWPSLLKLYCQKIFENTKSDNYKKKHTLQREPIGISGFSYLSLEYWLHVSPYSIDTREQWNCQKWLLSSPAGKLIFECQAIIQYYHLYYKVDRHDQHCYSLFEINLRRMTRQMQSLAYLCKYIWIFFS